MNFCPYQHISALIYQPGLSDDTKTADAQAKSVLIYCYMVLNAQTCGKLTCIVSTLHPAENQAESHKPSASTLTHLLIIPGWTFSD